MDVFEKIKERISLLDYVSRFVNLKPAGGKYVALCPFHVEKSASFNLDPAKNLFYCFGCSAGGDLFDFYAMYHNVEKKEALRALASLANIELVSTQKKNDLDVLAKFFVSQLTTKESEYLKKRGVTDKSIEKFQIGYAPKEKEILNFIKQNKLNLKKYGFDDYFWKMFQERIVFPIYNASYELCSFGGRSLDEKRAKYINGPVSAYFDKSKTLYSAYGSSSDLYIVEGYFDVILAFQNGLKAVAAMGTSFGKDHLQKAWKVSNNLVVALDADIAGAKSATKIAYMALDYISVGKTIGFIEFDSGEDPASFLQKGGKIEDLSKKNLSDYIFELIVKPVNDPDKAALILEQLNLLASKIQSKILANEYKRKWRQDWWNFFHRRKKNQPASSAKFVNLMGKNKLELLLFKYILLYPEILDTVEELFVRLDLSDRANLQRLKLVNNQELDEDFVNQINDVGIVEKIESAEDALVMWHKLFEKLQYSAKCANLTKRFEK